MDANFLERLRRCALTEEEGEVIPLRSANRDKVLEECSLSLIGRFHTTKPINIRAAKTLLRSVWKFGQDLQMTGVGDGLIQFKFSMDSQFQWVLQNGPWSFDNQLLLLQCWERGMTALSVNFLTIPLWVQVWGLPFDLFNEEASTDIGNGIGTVVAVDSKSLASDQARFLRIRVEVPLDKLLHRGASILSPEGDTIWVVFHYEHLVGLCFQCGRLGHEAKACTTLPEGCTQKPYVTG